MDETWIHYFTSESKRSSADWTAAGESCRSDQKIKRHLVRLCPLHFETYKEFCSLTTLRKSKQLILHAVIGPTEC